MIKCKVCEKEFGFINHTHLKMHGMTTKDYLEKFPFAPLCDDEYRQRASKQAIDRDAIPPNLSFEERSASRKGKTYAWRNPELRSEHLSEALRNSPKFKAYVEREKVERRGENNPDWKGGCDIAVFTLSFPEQYAIHDRIRTRDNNECQVCHKNLLGLKKRGHIHHIDHDRTNWKDGNLITLCNRHHTATNHGKSVEQVREEYLASIS